MATKCGDLLDYYTGAYMRPATEAERNASREASKYDGGAGVILLDADSAILAADDAGADDAARCYVSE